MAHSTVGLLDLPEEILLLIMSKISNADVLHSLMGACEKLDRLARDLVHIRSIDLTETTSDDEIRPLPAEVLARFSEAILPRIHQNIECLTVESSSIRRIFQSIDYPKLSKLILFELDLQSVSEYFDGKFPHLNPVECFLYSEQTSFIRICNEQILHAVVAVVDKSESATSSDVARNLYLPIFNLFKSVTHLDFVIKDDPRYRSLSLTDLPSNACFSSTVVHLSIKVLDLEDCLSLLDGRLNQLHTFRVQIHYICSSTDALEDTKSLPNLKCFSLVSHIRTEAYDTHVVPLLQRMPALERLTLSLAVKNRTSFIDGIHFHNEIENKMPYLTMFVFDVVTYHVPFTETNRPSSDDIRHTFSERTSVGCYVAYDQNDQGRCHVYSLPLPLSWFHWSANDFPGEQFIHVRSLFVRDTMRSFEPKFVQRIARSFPFLRSLSVFNLAEQRSEQCSDQEQISSIVEYPHLTELDLEYARIDCVKQFLINTRTSLPRLHTLRVQYEHLTMVTNHFTNDATRLHCAKVKRLFTEETMVHSKDLYLYFPSL